MTGAIHYLDKDFFEITGAGIFDERR